jgi:signal peptidase II
MNDVTQDWRQSGVRWWWITAVIVVLDQLTKLWVLNSMELYETITVLPVFDLFHTFNTGAAWSFLADAGGWQRWAFSALAVGVSVALAIWLRKLALAHHHLLVGGLTLILGGAIGNVIDRIRLGHVVDFVLLHWGDARFPAFNVADMAISVGAALVILDSVLEHRREKRAALLKTGQ